PSSAPPHTLNQSIPMGGSVAGPSSFPQTNVQQHAVTTTWPQPSTTVGGSTATIKT
ncbi:unnamed protein product, partial [Amoebophrya sp. A25]